MTGRRCPDCGVSMESVDVTDGDGLTLGVRTGETPAGLLGKLGVDERLDLDSLMCPECGLVRLYADVGE